MTVLLELRYNRKVNTLVYTGEIITSKNFITGGHIMTRRILNRLGINASVFGYVYIDYAVGLVKQDRELLNHVTSKLYPAVASHFGVSPTSVERTIRYAISNCWEKGNRQLLNDIAGRELTERPYTREFIAMLADYMEDSDTIINMQLAMLRKKESASWKDFLPYASAGD